MSATPALRQCITGSMERSQNDDTWIMHPPNGTAAHNCLVLLFQSDSSPSSCTITDDKSSTWPALLVNFLGDSQKYYAAILPDCVADIRDIQIVFNASTKFVQFNFSEWANVLQASPFRNSSTNSGITGSSIATSGSIGAAGDLVLQYIADNNANYTTSFTKGSGFTKLSSNLVDGTCVQYQVAAGAVTPTMTKSGPATQYDTIAIALKPSASAVGDATLPNGAIEHVLHQNVSAVGTVYPMEFPHAGNCILVSSGQGDPAINLSGVTSSPSESWVKQGFTNTSPCPGYMEHWGVGSLTPNSDRTITATYTGASGARFGMLILYSLVGTDASPFGATVHAQGTQSVTGNLTTLTGVTPARANSTIICTGGVQQNTVNKLLGGTKFYSDMMSDPASAGSDIQLDEADPMGHYYNGSDLSAQSFVWQTQNNPSGVGNWGVVATEIFSGVASAPGSALEESGYFPSEPQTNPLVISTW